MFACSFLFFIKKKVSIWKRSFAILALLEKEWLGNPLSAAQHRQQEEFRRRECSGWGSKPSGRRDGQARREDGLDFSCRGGPWGVPDAEQTHTGMGCIMLRSWVQAVGGTPVMALPQWTPSMPTDSAETEPTQQAHTQQWLHSAPTDSHFQVLLCLISLPFAS